MKIIFCGAHPDDAEIYAYGTLFAYKGLGAGLIQVMACNGDGGLTARSKLRPLAETRREEAERSAAMLGSRLIQLGYGDATLCRNRYSLSAQLEQIFTTEMPDLIITHSINDYHVDHRVLSAAVTMAAAEQYPIAYADNMKGQSFQPSHYVDITGHLEQKLLCLRQHQSQKPRRYVLACRELAARRGREATGTNGVQMEAFRLERYPRFKAPFLRLSSKVTEAKNLPVIVPSRSAATSGLPVSSGGDPP